MGFYLKNVELAEAQFAEGAWDAIS